MENQNEYRRESGFGRNIWSISTPYQLRESYPAEVFQSEFIKLSRRGMLPIGLRRSYGDSSLNSGGVTLQTSSLNGILIDAGSATAIVGSGVKLYDLESRAIQFKLFPPTVPGTGFITIGGAIAMDIHGKSHHKTGSFSRSIRRIKIMLSSSEIMDLYPYGETAEYFWATVGGLGLTGVILEAEMELRRVTNNLVDACEFRFNTLDQILSKLKESDNDFEHSVAWLDFNGGGSVRGLVGLGNYSSSDSEKTWKTHKARESLTLPYFGGTSLVNSYTTKVFNEIWFRKPLVRGPITLKKFLHPLDGLNNWNQIYGSKGFLQYQYVVPDGNEDFLERTFQVLSKINSHSFLSVLKRFGPAKSGLMSFPMEGWTLALDLPAGNPLLQRALEGLDAELVHRGGRLYLAKDSRTSPEMVKAMYPDFLHWNAVRKKMDPLGLWKSDQARRLEIC